MKCGLQNNQIVRWTGSPEAEKDDGFDAGELGKGLHGLQLLVGCPVEHHQAVEGPLQKNRGRKYLPGELSSFVSVEIIMVKRIESKSPRTVWTVDCLDARMLEVGAVEHRGPTAKGPGASLAFGETVC